MIKKPHKNYKENLIILTPFTILVRFLYFTGLIILQICRPLKTEALTEELYVFMETEISLTVDHAARGDSYSPLQLRQHLLHCAFYVGKHSDISSSTDMPTAACYKNALMKVKPSCSGSHEVNYGN